MINKNDVIQKVTHKVVEKAIESFGEKVNRIILYGSYARGDFTSESDIDVMILLNCDHKDLPSFRRLVAEIASDVSLDNDIEVSLLIEDVYTFEKWLNALVFYQNVKKEGIILYE
ncbi:MAG: nucleotidyltransferase domain-containing protein [Eubacterium sp.]|nr:nucleotidyltransferase domain-containing protein [Eubacterium sp.]MBR1674980.1 nucleotidyltransferase domain-containing protein [Eubacterium sp.]